MKTINLFLLFFFLFTVSTYSGPGVSGIGAGKPSGFLFLIFLIIGCLWLFGYILSILPEAKSDNEKNYRGELKHGTKNRKGTYTWSDCSKYKGEWRDDKMHGRGTMFYTNGNKKYVGEWQNG